MAAYRDGDGAYGKKSAGGGKIIAVALVILALIVVVLFATGFWSADVKEGALPDVDVSGGALPKVDVDSKEVVVGTTSTTVDVPKVTTEKAAIDVPVIGVRDNGEK